MKLFLALLLLNFCRVAAQPALQDFSLVNVADGSTVSMQTYAKDRLVAVIFASNSCPYDGYYRERIKKLVQTYDGKVGFLLINSGTDAKDSPEKMKEAYASWGINAPYLADKDQVALKALIAQKTPEVRLLAPGGFTVIYDGAIDDNPQMAAAVTAFYLKTAIDRWLSGSKELLPGVEAVGCTIRKK